MTSVIAVKMGDGGNRNGESKLRILTMSIVVRIADGEEH